MVDKSTFYEVVKQCNTRVLFVGSMDSWTDEGEKLGVAQEGRKWIVGRVAGMWGYSKNSFQVN